jgi:hypothetical protein
MIHCTTEDLIALKDGEGSSWARRHSGECPQCRGELDALHQRVARLKALPAMNPPRDRWPAVRERILAERRQRRGVHLRWAAVAVAATVVAIIGTRALDQRQLRLANEQEYREILARNQQLEAELRQYGPEGRVLNGAAAGAVSELEDRIAAIDAAIGPAVTSIPDERELNLWRNRAALMQGLVNVHHTRAVYLGM